MISKLLFRLHLTTLLLVLVLLLPEPIFTSNETELKNYCEKLQKGEVTLLAMGPMGKNLYLIDSHYTGVMVPRAALSNATLYLSGDSSAQLISNDWVGFMVPDRFSQPGQTTAFFYLASPKTVEGLSPVSSRGVGQPSIAIISPDHSWVFLNGLHSGTAGDGSMSTGGYGFTRAPSGGLPAGVFLSVDTSSLRVAAIYDSATGSLTLTMVARLYSGGKMKNEPTPSIALGTTPLVPGIDVDGGFVSLEEGGLSYGFKTSTGLITIIDNTTKSAITVPYKDFFQCSGGGGGGTGATNFALLVGGLAGGALLFLVLLCGVCVWKANKFAKKALKTRKTKSTAPTSTTGAGADGSTAGSSSSGNSKGGGKGGGGKQPSENKVKATPSLESMGTAVGKKSSKVGGLSKLKQSRSAISTGKSNSAPSSKSSSKSSSKKGSPLKVVPSKSVKSAKSAGGGGGGTSPAVSPTTTTPASSSTGAGGGVTLKGASSSSSSVSSTAPSSAASFAVTDSKVSSKSGKV